MNPPKSLASKYRVLSQGASDRPIIRPGDVYRIADKLVVLPEERDRKPHETDRRVVVLQSASVTAVANQPTVLVAPASSTHPAGPFDLDFDEDVPNGFTRPPTIFLSLAQPILITELGKRE